MSMGNMFAMQKKLESTMNAHRRLFLSQGLLLAGSLSVTWGDAWAQAKAPARKAGELVDDRKAHIARATRLSILSDRITRCKVQIALGVLPPRATKVYQDSMQEVKRVVVELGAAALPAVAKPQMAAAAVAYESFLQNSLKLNMENRANLLQFAEEADVVGSRLDTLVDTLVADAGQSTAQVLVSTADIQRLSQHTAVHSLLARAGIQEAQQLNEVVEGRKDFDKALAVLRASPLKNPEINAQMQLLEPQWLLMAAALNKSGSDMQSLEHICTTSERILEVSTDLYGLYEAAVKI